ncbi:MAG: hypothetical protein WC564_03020 [Patescibacteria group bacterium]|jgi:hypothetical protein
MKRHQSDQLNKWTKPAELICPVYSMDFLVGHQELFGANFYKIKQ